MTDSTTPAQVFDSLWRLAHCACVTIERKQPDLLIVLYKSGQIVQLAVETLWRATRTESLPPLLAINLGTEKLNGYFKNDWRYDGLEYTGPEDIGRLLAWAQQQKIWLARLHTQVAQTFGNITAPRRILVLDDVIHDGGTALLALGLLWTLYPASEAWVLGGLPPAWRQILGWQWAEEEQPAALAALIAKLGVNGELPKERRANADHHWGKLLTGLVDDPDNPLAWQPLTEDTAPFNEIFMAMGKLSLLLQVAPSVQKRVVAFIQDRLQTQTATPYQLMGRILTTRRGDLPQIVTLTWQEKLWAYAWQQRAVQVAELRLVCGVTAEEITTALEGFVKDELMAGVNTPAGPQYTVRPRLGALACNTLLTHPNPDFVNMLWSEIPDRRVHMAAEYAYANPRAAGAPILIPVFEPYQPQTELPIFTMWPATFEDDLINALYRQTRAERKPLAFDRRNNQQPPTKPADLTPKWLYDTAGLATIIYYTHEPNLNFALDMTVPFSDRAMQLAQLAIASVTAETYQAGTDGIHYLATAIQMGIQTPLTPYYAQAILQLTGNAQNLAEARAVVAEQQGLAGQASSFQP